jgi:uncharacterized protein (TIGR02145 family)
MKKDQVCIKIPLRLYFVLLLSFLFATKKSHSEELTGGPVIGMYQWSSQNLNVTRFRNGDSIIEAKSEEEWKKAATNGTPAWCYFKNDPANSKKYGILYNWYAVNDPRGLSPEGWGVPTRRELQSLIETLGTQGGHQLKSNSGWVETKGGSDEMHFGAVPGGLRYIGGSFDDDGKFAYFWTGTSKGNDIALYFNLGYRSNQIDSTSIFSYLKKGAGMSVRCVRRIVYGGFEIMPKNSINDGILFVDHEATSRSGHYGSALAACKNGDILAFYTNVSGKIYGGHGIAGWSEYKRSTDGGKTWGKPAVLEYTKRIWDLNKMDGDSLPGGGSYFAVRATAVVTAPNGTLVAFLSRQLANNRDNYLDFKTPMYLLSYDNGNTWTEPKEVDELATSKQISLTNQDGASFVHQGVIYTVFIGGYGTGEYTMYASSDNGETFTKLSDGLFKGKKYRTNYYYTSARALNDGRLIVYSYNMDDEHNWPYITSSDNGRTWSEVKTTYMAKRVRGAEITGKIGGYYFLVGRSGSFGNDPLNLVLYASKNGVDWDSGRYLKRVQKTLDAYSAIEMVSEPGSTKPSKILIQSTVGYGLGANVNIKHWWIEGFKE